MYKLTQYYRYNRTHLTCVKTVGHCTTSNKFDAYLLISRENTVGYTGRWKITLKTK